MEIMVGVHKLAVTSFVLQLKIVDFFFLRQNLNTFDPPSYPKNAIFAFTLDKKRIYRIIKRLSILAFVICKMCDFI